MSTKGDEECQQLRPGMPDIALPDDDEAWELQTTSFTAFLFEMWQRVEARDKKASLEARAELTTFLLNSLGQLLRVALNDGNGLAKRWACRLLADVFVSICKDVGKVRIKKPYGRLMKIKAFRDEKNKIGRVRTNLLSPGLVQAIAQRELKKAERHRRTLLLHKAGCVSDREQKRREKLAKERGFELADHERGTTWKQAAERLKIPRSYWLLVKFPEFSTKYFDQWFSFLWPLISKKIDLAELESHYRMARKRYPADSQNTVHDHLKTLAKLREKGAFYFF